MNLNKIDYFIQSLVEVIRVLFFFLAKSDQIDRLAKAHSCRKTTETQYYLQFVLKCSALVTQAD